MTDAQVSQIGNAWGFVAIGVLEATGREGVEGKIRNQSSMVLPIGVNFVALPPAQSDGANIQPASGFRLVDSQLEAAPAQMAADSGWIFRNGNFTIAGWQVFAAGDAQNPFTKRQRRAHLMKLFLLTLAVLVSPLPPAWAASAEEEERFLAAVKTAFEKHDANALVALSCWDRVPEKLKESGRKQYVRDVALTATDITLTPPDPKFPDLEWKDAAGVAYRSNLPVIKQLKITFARGAGFKAGRYPVGEKDGKLYLLEPAPVK